MIDRLFARLPTQASAMIDDEGWVRERGPEVPDDSKRGASSESYVTARSFDGDTRGRLDPATGLTVPDHFLSISANAKANKDILSTVWSGHQLALGRHAVAKERMSGGAAAWTYALAFFRELVGYPVLAAFAIAENRGHIEFHKQALRRGSHEPPALGSGQ